MLYKLVIYIKNNLFGINCTQLYLLFNYIVNVFWLIKRYNYVKENKIKFKKCRVSILQDRKNLSRILIIRSFGVLLATILLTKDIKYG